MSIRDDVNELYQIAIEAEEKGIPHDALMQDISKPYTKGIRFLDPAQSNRLSKNKSQSKKVNLNGAVTRIEIDSRHTESEKELANQSNLGLVLFMTGFLLFPAWWVGSFKPKRSITTYQRKWKKINRGMAIASLFAICVIIAVLVWQWKKFGYITKSDSK